MRKDGWMRAYQLGSDTADPAAQVSAFKNILHVCIDIYICVSMHMIEQCV